MNWYLAVLKNYADFSGRARRKEYWMFVLFNIIFLIVAMILDNVLGTAIEGVGYGLFYILYSLAVLIPGLAVLVRRLHDVGKSGWMILIALIPIIGAIWLLVLMVIDSNPDENEYGPNPKEVTFISNKKPIINEMGFEHKRNNMSRINKLEEAIKEFDLKYTNEKSKNVIVLDAVDEKYLVYHKKKNLRFDSDEKPLLVLNPKKSFTLTWGFTYFVITNKYIHFALLKRSFFTSLFFLKEKPDRIKLESVDSFQIGEHDSCFGTAYIGHDLRINNQTLGLVRLGFSMFYDDKALNYINELSQYLFDNGLLSNPPKEFIWQ